jgi:hypothetical protein
VADRVTAAFGGKLADIPSLRYFGEAQRVAVFDGARGWVGRVVREAAEHGKPTLIDRAAFDRELRALVRRVQAGPLAAAFDPSSSPPIDPNDYARHGFFRQLEWIDIGATFAHECIIHYAHAKAARVRWAAEPDAISEASLRAYEEDLKARWKLNVFRQSLKSHSTPETKGRELLAETLSADVPLDGQSMPRQITSGNYHALADFDTKKAPDLGWHPDYETLAEGPKKTP